MSCFIRNLHEKTTSLPFIRNLHEKTTTKNNQNTPNVRIAFPLPAVWNDEGKRRAEENKKHAFTTVIPNTKS